MDLRWIWLSPSQTTHQKIVSCRFAPKISSQREGAHKLASNVSWDWEVHPPSFCSVPQSASTAPSGARSIPVYGYPPLGSAFASLAPASLHFRADHTCMVSFAQRGRCH
ncbi:hypothetical protein C8R44DRAFT_147655 [Mycena epipterygia]|nr:hypothetical protein C8R44DRAFT_147655 [Mycena epipterygia]